MSTIFATDTVRDIAEQQGVSSLPEELAKVIAQETHYRVGQYIEETYKVMRHERQTVCQTRHVTQAARNLEVEGLQGYETTAPLRYGEAQLGGGQTLYYVEDEEVDLEKLVNAPLPKVPREISMTAHWTAIEGVQPTIPQNAVGPVMENAMKGSTMLQSMVAAGSDNTSANKPLVKHVLSKELQILFEKVSDAILNREKKELRYAATSTLRNDPGLHQLLPYFVQFIRERVTHDILDLFVLEQMMHMTGALLQNEHLFIDPYVAAIVPAILTCLVGKRLGNEAAPLASYPLRELASSLIQVVCDRFGETSHTLRPRLVRSLTKGLLDPAKPHATHFGCIYGMHAAGGVEAVRTLIVPTIKLFEAMIRDDIVNDTPSRVEAEACRDAVLHVLGKLYTESVDYYDKLYPNFEDWVVENPEEAKKIAVSKYGEMIGSLIMEKSPKFVKVMIKMDDSLQ